MSAPRGRWRGELEDSWTLSLSLVPAPLALLPAPPAVAPDPSEKRWLFLLAQAKSSTPVTLGEGQVERQPRAPGKNTLGRFPASSCSFIIEHMHRRGQESLGSQASHLGRGQQRWGWWMSCRDSQEVLRLWLALSLRAGVEISENGPEGDNVDKATPGRGLGGGPSLRALECHAFVYLHRVVPAHSAHLCFLHGLRCRWHLINVKK